MALGAAAFPAAPRRLKFYPERRTAREPGADRFVAELGFFWHGAFRRRLVDAGFAAQVGRHRSEGPPAARVAALRYRLRRDGFTTELSAECLGLACAALDGEALPPYVLAAARLLLNGGIVELADARERRLALALAALARAIQGVPVHWLAASDAGARGAAQALQAALEALGMSAACIERGMAQRERRTAYGAAVACASLREVALDYLRDRLQAGPRVRALHGLLERLSGDAPAAAELTLRGLHCALVEDADVVMLDDAHTPLVMTAEPDLSGERLLHEQALELARALAPGTHFSLDEQAAQLTAAGSQHLAQLSVLLGPLWTARQRREELVVAALNALHGGTPQQSPQRDVLLRMSVPRFLGRYLHLAGVCADARGLEREFWTLYGLKAIRAGAAAPAMTFSVRTFASADERRAAVLQAARSRGNVVIAVRTQAEAQALAAANLPLTLYPAHRQVEAPQGARAPLHLVVAELHDSPRHLAQIGEAYGARSCEMLLTAEEVKFPLPACAAGWLGRRALRRAERAQALARREIVARERQLEELLAFSGQPD